MLRLAVTSSLDAGTYTVRFDNGSGSVHEIEVAVSEGATYVIVDISDLWDDEARSFWVDIADDSGASLLDSGTTTVNLTHRLYLHYGLHSPVVATNQDGETVWRRAYLPFGADFAGSPSHPLTIANSSITHGFVGRRQDNDVGLYKLGARWYDPDLGRFVSTDPIPGLINQYEYAHNNPITFQDSNGMQYGGPGYTQWAENSSLSGGTVSVKEVVKELKTFADLSTAFVPGVNDVRDVFECTSGYDAINVTELQWYWRATSCVGIAAASGAGVRKAGLLISGVTRYGDDVASHADEVAGIGKYWKNKGHHIHAAAGFTDHVKYSKSKGFSISKEFMEENGLSHLDMTNEQRRQFRELAESGRPNTLEEHSRIAYESLIAGGATPEMAEELVGQSLRNLAEQGVEVPTNIPWYNNK